MLVIVKDPEPLNAEISALKARLAGADAENERLLMETVRLRGELTQANLRLARYDGGAARA